ncbi:hypothetical protein N0V95_007177, partial [Ascochyta clinopodiicola]
MIPGDISDIPTLACLNKPQKRALILRDQLRYLEPAHLDTFLDGVTADEPPTYRSVNGNVWPPLAQITIRESATRFDLGNVQFPEEGGKTHRAWLTVEDERFEMRTEEPLPKDDTELASVSIHRFVAENMFPLFKTKYKAIHARMEKINEARRVAYNMLNHPPAKFEEGECFKKLTKFTQTLARLHSARPKTNEDSSRGKFTLSIIQGVSRKRKEITKHVSNKRQRIGLDTIPDTVKSETFNTIPAQIKVDLFNNIIKTAFPNFDNLIIASWNVVSVYSNVGSDFPELHKAVVELKGALEEFESAYAPPRSRHGKARKEATPSLQSGRNGSRTPTPAPAGVKEGRGTPSAATPSIAVLKHSHRDDGDAVPPQINDEVDDEEEEEGETDSKHRMPPPLLRPTQHLADEELPPGPLHPDPQSPPPPSPTTTSPTLFRAPSAPRTTTHSPHPRTTPLRNRSVDSNRSSSATLDRSSAP